MTRVQISKPLSVANAAYEVVVIGSGYGASIAASRLARAGREVAVLERGARYGPATTRARRAILRAMRRCMWPTRGSGWGGPMGCWISI